MYNAMYENGLNSKIAYKDCQYFKSDCLLNLIPM
jgi:hypothetical protein